MWPKKRKQTLILIQTFWEDQEEDISVFCFVFKVKEFKKDAMTWNYEYFSNLQDIQSKLIFVQHKDFEPLSLQHK